MILYATYDKDSGDVVGVGFSSKGSFENIATERPNCEIVEITSDEYYKLKERLIVVERGGIRQAVRIEDVKPGEDRFTGESVRAYRIEKSRAASKTVKEREIKTEVTYAPGIGGEELVFSDKRPESIISARRYADES